METATQQSKILGREAEALRSILEMLPSGVLFADREGKIMFHNRAAREILGPEDALSGAPSQWTNVFGWYHADQTTLLSPEELPLRRALRGEDIDGEILFILNASRPDGVSVSVSVKPMRDTDNRINAALMLCREVTEEQLSDQSRALLSQVVEQIADGVLLTDKQGRIEYVNPAFEVMTGFKHEDVRGQ
jgi:PAS domain-containing protein